MAPSFARVVAEEVLEKRDNTYPLGKRDKTSSDWDVEMGERGGEREKEGERGGGRETEGGRGRETEEGGESEEEMIREVERRCVEEHFRMLLSAVETSAVLRSKNCVCVCVCVLVLLICTLCTCLLTQTLPSSTTHIYSHTQHTHIQTHRTRRGRRRVCM